MIKYIVSAQLVLLLGCKDKGGAEESEQQAPQAIAEATPTEVETPPVEPPLPALSETSLALFDVSTQTATTPQWERHAGAITFRASATKAAAERNGYDVEVFAKIAEGEDKLLFTCPELRATSKGRVELLLRGDYLHVLCINEPAGDALGNTEGGRFGIDEDTGELTGAGNYAGPGIVDPDTIDFDEGELGQGD